MNSNYTAGVFQNILQLILRRRLLCNHGTLLQGLSQDDSSDSFSEHDESLNLLRQIGRASCASCGHQIDCLHGDEDGTAGVLKGCSHFICQECEGKLATLPGSRKREWDSQGCNLCSEMMHSRPSSSTNNPSMPLSEAYPTPPQSVDGRTSPLSTSTKVSKLVDTIKAGGPTCKSVVFSCWRKTLLLVECELTNNSIPSVRMDGTVSPRDRQRVIEAFNGTTVPVMLMTTGTGSVGLSLPMANHVFILEPQWNPAVEKQAIGRVLRLGQERPVTVTRFIMRNTIEGAVRSRQSKKIKIAELTWEKDSPEEHTRRTLMDLRDLF
jgi:SWI/SNF-related matrix-associated actin-dependent regulator of chromatin subfamily A3